MLAQRESESSGLFSRSYKGTNPIMGSSLMTSSEPNCGGFNSGLLLTSLIVCGYIFEGVGVGKTVPTSGGGR